MQITSMKSIKMGDYGVKITINRFESELLKSQKNYIFNQKIIAHSK